MPPKITMIRSCFPGRAADEASTPTNDIIRTEVQNVTSDAIQVIQNSYEERRRSPNLDVRRRITSDR